ENAIHFFRASENALRRGDVQDDRGLVLIVVNSTDCELPFAIADNQRNRLPCFPAETSAGPDTFVRRKIFKEVTRTSISGGICFLHANGKRVHFTDEIESQQRERFFCVGDNGEIFHPRRKCDVPGKRCKLPNDFFWNASSGYNLEVVVSGERFERG